MKTSYSVKLSSQGQLTLPAEIRKKLGIQPRQYITLTFDDKLSTLHASSDLPIEKFFGKLTKTWTKPGQDAAEYTRSLRNTMQPKHD